MSARRCFEVALVLALLAVISVPAFPQSSVSLGTIEGTVKDATGGVLPGVSVTIRQIETGFTRTAVTNASGNFRAPLLPVGDYVLTLQLAGFKTMVREGLILTVGGTVTLANLVLEVATVEETVTVTTESPIVETGRAVLASTIRTDAIDNLPANSRDFQDFATLTPTVIREADRDTLSMAGAKGIDTGVMVDGQDFTNTFFGSAHGQPEVNQFVIPQEAVQEFQVMANGFSAEFGRSAGGVLNVVTKSGTNDFQGSGYYFGRNEALLATLEVNDPQSPSGLSPVPKTDFSQNQFGATLGGPIARDKAHFFASVSHSRFDSPFLVRFNQDVSNIPSNTQIYGAPIAGVDVLNDLQGEFKREVVLTAFLVKTDIQLTPSNTLSLRYNFSEFTGENFGASAGGVEGNVQSSSQGNTESTSDTAHSLVVSNTTVIGTNKFNEFKFQYAYEDRPRRSNNPNGPDVRIDGCCRYGRLGFLPILSDHTRWQFTDNFTYLFGDHDLKLGFDFNYTETSQAFFGFSAGEWRFFSLDDYVNGAQPRSLFQRAGLNGFTTVESGTIAFSQKEYAVYINDTWRPSPGLTLTLGLRWEGLSNPDAPTEAFGLPARNPDNPGAVFGLNQPIIPNDYTQWQPRFGFAYDPSNDGRTVIRGGAGIFNSRTPLLLWAAVQTTNAYRQGLYFFFRPTFIDFPNILPESGIPPDDPLTNLPSEVFFANPDYVNPRNQRFNLGVEHELGEDFAVGVDGVYAHSTHQQRRRNFNLDPPVATDAVGRGLYSDDLPDPRYTNWWVESSVGNAQYRALVLSAKQRMRNNFTFQAFYTLSTNKSHDDNERDASSSRISQQSNLNADWGYSVRDVRHRFVSYFLYQLPQNITTSVVFTANSGRAFDVLSGDDDDNDGNDDADRGIVDASNRARVDAIGQDQLPDGLQPRGTGRQPSFYNFDWRFQWSPQLGPGQLDVIFEVFNLFNSANRSISEDLQELPLDNFGLPDLIGTARQAQFGVRYRF